MEGRISGGQVLLGVLAYVPVLFLLPLAVRRKQRFLLFHTRQGLYLFSVFLVLVIVFLGAFSLFHFVIDVPVVKQILAVVVLMAVVGYGVLVILMAGSVMMRRMVMLPVLGELAGER